MRFKDENVRHEFHALDTSLQYAFLEFETRLNSLGKFMYVDRILMGSEVIVRIDSQLKLPADTLNEPHR